MTEPLDLDEYERDAVLVLGEYRNWSPENLKDLKNNCPGDYYLWLACSRIYNLIQELREARERIRKLESNPVANEYNAALDAEKRKLEDH